jgi:uncharacterized protein (TIGR03067 family)
MLMRTLTPAAIIVLLALSGAQGGDQAVVKKELEALRGNWNAVIKGAVDTDQKLLQQFSMVENSLQIRIGGNHIDFTFTVDPTKKPKEITLATMLRDGSDRSMPGIYELDGDTLKLCLGERRPTEFKTDAASKQSSFVLKREKKKDR